MACAIEDAGFEIRDQIMWIYGQGFPKSLNIGKAVDKLQGNKREVIKKDRGHTGERVKNHEGLHDDDNYEWIGEFNVTKGTSEWEGWGTALKPAHEPIVLARKPLSEKTIVENILKWGVGGLAIDNCRIETNENLAKDADGHKLDTTKQGWGFKAVPRGNEGRFPANVIHDGSDEVVKLFPNSKAGSFKGDGSKSGGIWNKSTGQPAGKEYGDYGSVARFFYCAKASTSERNFGCENLFILKENITKEDIVEIKHLLLI
jgi:site-specific DNA-methyltransferase (adenine-specific)